MDAFQPRHVRGVGQRDSSQTLPAGARVALEQVDLLEKAGARVRSLSGGQRQRLGVATALAHEPDRILLAAGRPGFLVAGVLVFGVTLLRTGEALSWSYQEWAYTNGLFEGFALALTGPIAAAFGAFLSGRLTPPSRLYALPRFSRDTVQFLAQSLTPAVLVVTSGYLLALVPVVVQTYRTGRWIPSVPRAGRWS